MADLIQQVNPTDWDAPLRHGSTEIVILVIRALQISRYGMGSRNQTGIARLL